MDIKSTSNAKIIKAFDLDNVNSDQVLFELETGEIENASEGVSEVKVGNFPESVTSGDLKILKSIFIINFFKFFKFFTLIHTKKNFVDISIYQMTSPAIS